MEYTFLPKRLFIILTVSFFIMPVLIRAQEPIWLLRLKQQKWMNKVAKLKILRTNRGEAEQILGKPDIQGDEKIDFIRDYNIENGRVILTYTTKECSSTEGKISKDTIEEILFTPDSNNISFSKLKIPINQFKKVPNGDTPGFSYQNERYGVSLYVDKNRVEEVVFEIPEPKNFNCVTPSSFLNDLEKIKNIKLLHSNRDEVRKIFVEYNKSIQSKNSGYNETFSSSDASFEFTYSIGECQFEGFDGYNSKEWNVQSISISPVNNIDPKEYGIDLTIYKKEQIYKNISDLYVYYDKNSGISFRVSQGKIDEINFFPSQRYNSLMCDKEKTKILSSTDSLFTEKLKDRIASSGGPAFVDKLYLSQSEIKDCNSSDTSETPRKIEVFTRAGNPLDDVLTYSYTVSGGKIVGQGIKVIWDLSGVKAGTYSITAAVDDGCGFCGAVKTQKVVVKDNSNCAH